MSKKRNSLVSMGLDFGEDAVRAATQHGGLEDTLFKGPDKYQQDSKAAKQRPARGRPRKDAPPPETKKATYYLERTVARALNVYAAEQERSASDIVSEAIKTYLHRHKKEL